LFSFSALVFSQGSTDLLAKLLADKGIISAAELEKIESAGEGERVGLLVSLLEAKGILRSDDLARLNLSSAQDRVQSAHVISAVYTPASPTAATAPPQVPAGPDTTTAPPVTSQSKAAVTLYGNILLNAFFDTSLTNIEDVALFTGKQGSDPFPNDKTFGMTARQTRLGLKYEGPEVAGAKLSGQVEVDFLGGKAAFSNGINMDLLRLRLALGRLDWTNFSFVAGQDWSIFAPLNPTSFAEYAIPSMSASGNPWIRQPQIRAELRHAMSDTFKLQWQLAAADPNMGDYQTTTFSSGRTPGIGERGRMPELDTRLGFTDTVNGHDYAIGVSGHYGRGKNVGTLGTLNVVRPVDSWGVALDWSLPFSKYFNITGEAYEGRALGIFSVASGEAVGAVGTRGEHGVLSRGGWAQAQFNFNPKWQVNLAYGIDQPKASELPVGNRDRNQTYMGNLMYKLSSMVTFAWEYRRMLTDFRNQLFADERGDQANLAVVYSF
jgi:hypothetical protein